MANVYDYLSWRGDLSFKQDNFNEVDGLILAKLAYIPYEYFPVSLENNSAQIKDIAVEMLSNSHIVQDLEFTFSYSKSVPITVFQKWSPYERLALDNKAL